MMQWSHVGLNCRDTTATAEFYQRWFGFLPARAVPLDGQQILFLRRDDAHLELFPAAAPATAKNTGAGSESPGAIRHIAFQTDDVDAFLASMGEAAITSRGGFRNGILSLAREVAFVRLADGAAPAITGPAGGGGLLRRLFGRRS